MNPKWHLPRITVKMAPGIMDQTPIMTSSSHQHDGQPPWYPTPVRSFGQVILWKMTSCIHSCMLLRNTQDLGECHDPGPIQPLNPSRNGLYPENHGIMLNYMYNPDDNETFGISAAPYWWEQAEPVWITATKKGLRADMYFWPGCEVPIKSLKPKSCIKHIQKFSTMAFSKHMATAIEKLAKNESDIALVFCEQPDLFGHIFGPDSFAVKLMVRQLDLTFQDFLHDIETFNMREKVNVIIVSDHGMANVKTRVVLVNYINMDDILKTVDEGAVIGIYPKDGKLDKVFSDLTKVPNVRVWKKKDIPEEFHIKNNIRTPPIIVLANPGYSIQNVISAGHHGYDTKDSVDMRGIFLAFGPKFKTGVNIPPIKNQDVYNLIMKLCGLEPLPNNGTWDNIAMSLRTP